MKYTYVLTEKKEHLGILTLNRPDEGNRLNLQHFTDISNGIRELDSYDELRVLVVKANGDNFCMGADLAEILTLEDLQVNDFFLGLSNMYKSFRYATKPVIAAVHGYATAGGLGIALSADLVVASEDAYFGATAINVGLFCMNAAPVQLPRIVGSKKALEMGLTGEVINAKEAARLGIVNKVVPRDDLEKATLELAWEIASKSPLSVVLGKRAFYTCWDMDYIKGLDYAAEMMAVLTKTRFAREGMKAFLEKRKPEWPEWKGWQRTSK